MRDTGEGIAGGVITNWAAAVGLYDVEAFSTKVEDHIRNLGIDAAQKGYKCPCGK